jgi:hypothetical protein
MTEVPQQERDLSRRALLRNGLAVGAGVAMLGVVSTALSGAARAEVLQINWRWCIHCSGLWWAGNADDGQVATRFGVCPYQDSGQPHTFSGTGGTNYTMGSAETPGTGIQNGWRWCENCYGLFWGNGLAQNGICPIGIAHIASGSIYDMYTLPVTNKGASQGGWDWCGKCQGLYWGNGNNAAGICPAGGTHSPGSKTNYVMLHI